MNCSAERKWFAEQRMAARSIKAQIIELLFEFRVSKITICPWHQPIIIASESMLHLIINQVYIRSVMFS